MSEASKIPDKKLKLSPSPLMDLPNEIWMKIIGYLSSSDILKNFNLTCKHFHSLAINPGAIKFLKFKNVKGSGQYQEIVKVLKRSKFLNKIVIDGCSKYRNHILAHVLKSNHLKSLEVSDMYVSLTKKNMQYLENSRIENLTLNEITFNDNEMEQVGALKNLKSLTISISHPIRFSWASRTKMSILIESLVNTNARLEDLALVSFPSSCLIEINASTLKKFLKENTETLKKLKVRCYVRKDQSNNNIVKWNENPNLEELYFQDYNGSPLKLEFGPTMPKLTKLALISIKRETLSVFETQDFPLLERLYLKRQNGAGSPNPQTIYNILENCRNLKSVKLRQFELSNPKPFDEWHAFLYRVYKTFNAYIDILSHKPIDRVYPTPLKMFENYLKKTDLAVFYKYKKLKADYFDWKKEHCKDEW